MPVDEVARKVSKVAADTKSTSARRTARSGTFTDNMKMPVHRWFRYSAGFSADWVRSEIERFEKDTGKTAVVIDPFVGSGTTCFAACSLGKKSFGFDGHPFVARVAKAKNLWFLDEYDFLEACNLLVTEAGSSQYVSNRFDGSPLLSKCYSREGFDELDGLRHFYEKHATEDPIWELVWLNITSILRACSSVGTAQWQYILPNKTKNKVLNATDAFLAKSKIMAADMEFAKCSGWTNTATILEADVRENIGTKRGNLVITSPPYPNNYDYADATRLEMTFWGEIDGWGDLKTAVRPTLLRSCSQHSAGDKVVLDEILREPLLSPIIEELTSVTRELEEVRLTKGGRKAYHTMIAAYFLDLAKIWVHLRKITRTGSRVCYVIGDSAPYGVYVPAEKWLGQLALAAGFKDFHFEKLRDRNVKWKNRTHTVKLHEGRLWVNG